MKQTLIKSLLNVFAVLGLAVILAACDQAVDVNDRVSAARKRNDAPPIWVVEDVDSKLYLYGTVHLLPPELSWQHDDMRDVFNQSGTVFFEVPSDDAAKLKASVLTASLGFFKDGQRLSDRLDSYQLKLLSAAAHNSDIEFRVLDSMKPWLAGELLNLSAATQDGLSGDISADEALKSRARRLQKNIRYLDTIEQQLRLSADQPEFVQMTILVETLTRFNQLGENARKVAQAWATGNAAFLTDKVIKAAAAKSPDMYQALFIDRNIRWTQDLLPFMEGSGTGFVAVGIGHLLGDHSLQAQFREQGYEVKRYRSFQGEPVIRPVFIPE